MNTCFTLKPAHGPCLIILGRFGDVIQLCPAFREIHRRTGLKPVVMVSTDYASVLDGVSYVDPFPVHWQWWQGIPHARRLAEEQFGGGVVVQWWNDSPERITQLEMATTKGGLVLQSHGHEWGVDISRWPNYGTSMFDRAGFSEDEMRTLPLIFDLRDAEREARLVTAWSKRDKPMLLVNFQGYSSPFAPVPEVMRVINQFATRFNIVDLGRVKASRIYDLLGLYDAAAGLITTDTATLHLAPGSKVPYVAFTVNGWSTSVPKGNVQLEIKYSDALARVNELVPVLEGWLTGPKPVPAVSAANSAGGGGGMLVV